MILEEIKEHVKQSVDMFYTRDANLLSNDSSEWAIAHRLAVYLEQEIPGWNVDCEYNRQGQMNDPKKTPDEDIIRPDIILHHRRRIEIDHNLLIIEVKKNKTDADLEKLRKYTGPPQEPQKFQYQFGLALSVIDGPFYQWFVSGEKVE